MPVITELRYRVQTNTYRPSRHVAGKKPSECWEDNSGFIFPFDAMQRALDLTKSGYPVRILDAQTMHHIGIEVPDVEPGAVEVPQHILEAMEEVINGNSNEESPEEGQLGASVQAS